jgi:xylan 1,4-beta-xylosidase
MSYWAYSDLFEEPGPQTKPFDGGFGLMTPQGVRKPTWFAYKYLNSLGDRELPTGDDQSIAALKGDTVQVLAWRYELPDQPVSNRPFFRQVREPAAAAPLQIVLRGIRPGAYTASVRRVGFKSNDAYTAYLEMGSPATLSEGQLETLQTLTLDEPRTVTVTAGADGTTQVDLPMRVQDVVLVEIGASSDL